MSADNDPRQLFETGTRLATMGRHAEAIQSFRRVVEIAPDVSVAHFNLGNSYFALEQWDEAIASYRRAAELDSDPDTYNNLGHAYARQRKFAEAVAAFQDALKHAPSSVAILGNLARAHVALRDWNPAIETLTRWIDLSPNTAQAHALLGQAWHNQGLLDKAVPCYERALALDPRDQQARVGLGVVLAEQGRLTQAMSHYELALECNPNDPHIRSNIGLLKAQGGEPSLAIDHYRQVLDNEPSLADTHSNLLLAMQYLDATSGESLLREARHWASCHTAALPRIPPRAFVADPGRRLRVGYLSSDFRNHPVGHFMEPVIRTHDRARFEVFCYASQSFFDDLSYRMFQSAEHWQLIGDLDDETAAEQIRRDAIDILVDLNGHTANHRLCVLARRPAPIQATWLGYSGTTGLSEVDFILADTIVIPPNEECQYVEKVARLPEVYACFEPPHLALSVTPLPALRNGRLTFGSFNNLAKVTPEVIRLWSEVLRAVPNSQLLLKTKALGDSVVADRFRRMFAEQGISPDRLQLHGMSPRRELLAAYGQVDIGLDPFPFAGGVTTLESLWMGVPVVTLRGRRFVGHAGETFLRAAGLEDWIANDPADYVEKLVRTCADRARLSELRLGLRARLLASPICAHERFTRNLEELYQSLWKQHTAG